MTFLEYLLYNSAEQIRKTYGLIKKVIWFDKRAYILSLGLEYSRQYIFCHLLYEI